MGKKRKQLAHPQPEYSTEEALTRRLQRLLDNIREDEGKLEAFIWFCDKSITNTNESIPSWVTGSSSFFSTLGITPKEWSESRFEFLHKDEIDEIMLLVVKESLSSDFVLEEFTQLQTKLEKLLAKKLKVKTVVTLSSSIQKLSNTASKNNLGELVVTSAINEMLDVLCEVFSDVSLSLNGDKQFDVCLTDSLPTLNLRNDGFLSTKFITFFLREDKAFDKIMPWNASGTDGHKLIICMKSLLRKNMQIVSFKKEEMEKYSKVMGLSYLQQKAYLFILEAQISEEMIDNSKVLVPNYSIYMKEYQINQLSMLQLWLDIAYFVINYVPILSATTAKPYRPTSETPLKSLPLLEKLLSTTQLKQRSRPITKKKNESIEGHDVCIVKTESVIKTVMKEERNLIIKLMQQNEYCLYLPQILNIYEKEIEFECLHKIAEHVDDTYLLELACDISVALNYLHSNNIVHRDVKPQNIMQRALNYPSDCIWFVLIDFGISFEMEKDTTGKCYTIIEEKTLVSANVGTGFFKAPEVQNRKPYDEKIDIYSLGASLLYLKNQTVYTTLFRNLDDKPSNVQQSMSNVGWDIAELGIKVMQMVDPDPKKRPSANELAIYFSELCDKVYEQNKSESSEQYVSQNRR